MPKIRSLLKVAFAVSGLLLATDGPVSAGNCTCGECPPPEVEGRMTGGGVFLCSTGDECDHGGTRVTHGFELHCDASAPNNLEINWGGGNHFHLESLDSATCIDDPNIAPKPPAAPFDTFIGAGTGRLNGVSGATVQFVLTDAGEPGSHDTIRIIITDVNGRVVLDCDTTELLGGNHQAHRDTGNN